jgi:3-oxoacyl-[acyl-carrier protein] reductase
MRLKAKRRRMGHEPGGPEVDRAAAGIPLAASGRIDILVNCTALPILGAFLELQDADWEEVIQAKYLGYVDDARGAAGDGRANFGRIVNVSGRGGRQPTPAHLPDRA